MTDYKQRLDELVKLRDDWIDYHHFTQAITLAQETVAEVERLKAENFTLAAGVCDTAKGDEYGTLRCGSKQEVERLRAAADKMKEAINSFLSDNSDSGEVHAIYAMQEALTAYEQARGE